VDLAVVPLVGGNEPAWRLALGSGLLTQ
jgi:hypothetical protein